MANKKLRLDMALVERGFFQSRNRAQASIMAGEILVNGQADTRADRAILPEDVISIKEKSWPAWKKLWPLWKPNRRIWTLP